ncbi:MAG: hypothetical protein K2W86_15410 [Sphingomonas sp.]|nr:hypothetical protein [Sphingomonas sp.]
MVSLAMMLLSSCSDGGSSGSIAVVGATTPTSSPTPTPTSSATPTPAPTSYAAANDFTIDRSFTAIGALMIESNDPTLLVPSRIDVESSMIGFDFTAATRTYSARYGADTLQVRTQPVPIPNSVPTEFIDQFSDIFSAAETRFARSNGTSPITRYVGEAYWSQRDLSVIPRVARVLRQHYLLFGSATAPTDMPRGGTSSYILQADLGKYSPGVGGQPRPSGSANPAPPLTVDWTRRTISGAFTQVTSSGLASPVTTVNIAISANFDPLTGRITGVSGGNPIEGKFYGPVATNIGFVILTDSYSAGVIIGTKQ